MVPKFYVALVQSGQELFHIYLMIKEKLLGLESALFAKYEHTIRGMNVLYVSSVFRLVIILCLFYLLDRLLAMLGPVELGSSVTLIRSSDCEI